MRAYINGYVTCRMKQFFPTLNLSFADWAGVLLCAIPAFYLLGTPAIYIWDEAVYVNASLDMANGSSWIVPVQGEYNTKPPLVLWMQALFLMILPSAELAVRMPSALAVLGILIVLMAGLKRWRFDFITRILVMVCFVGHEGFIRHHIGRTGDLDAVMSFFVVVYVITMLDAIHSGQWTKKHFFFFFLAFIASYYAKSIAGWMMMAPLGVIWLMSPLRNVLIRPRFIIGVAVSVAICLMYYLIREQLQPGYIDLVWHSEFTRIAKNVMPWHEHPSTYYFSNFVILKTFTPWIFVFAGAALIGLMKLGTEKKPHLIRWLVLGLGYMLIISIPAVKLEWYDAPAYPFFALVTGVVAGDLLTFIPSKWRMLIFIPAVLILTRKISFIRADIHPRHPFEHEGAMLRMTDDPNVKQVFMQVEVPEHQLQLDFYRKIKHEEDQIEINVLNAVDEVKSGDEFLISQTQYLNEIQSLFQLDTLKHFENLGYQIRVGQSKLASD